MIINSPINSEADLDPPLVSRPVVLLLFDAWGIAPISELNPIASAKTTNFLNLIKEYPVALLQAGKGSWNVRYLTIGAGREILTENSKPVNTLSAVLSAANLKQLKIAETERLAALSYFFNGEVEQKYTGEKWKIISSESDSSEIKPLSALKQSVKEVIKAVQAEETFDFIVAAIPFLDLIAKKGNFLEIKQAMEILDQNLSAILGALSAKNGVLIISSAGGGAEQVVNQAVDSLNNYKVDNPVPMIIVGSEFKGKTIGLADPLNNDLSLLAPTGTLADLAPTILQIMGLDIPAEMTGKSLLNKE